MEPTLIESVLNHLVLPARLPSRADNFEQIDADLINRLIQATRLLSQKREPGGTVYLACDAVRRALQACKYLHAGRKLSKPLILAELRGLESGSFILLYVFEQNAALTIRRVGE